MLPLVFFCLWRYRLVSFHICKASRRSSKFCLTVADLHLLSFFLPRSPSTTPDSCLSRSSFSTLIGATFSSSHLLAPSCPAFRFMGRRKLAEKEQEKSKGVRSAVSFPLLQHFLLHLSSFLLTARISCVCVEQLRARGIISSQNVQRIPP